MKSCYVLQNCVFVPLEESFETLKKKINNKKLGNPAIKQVLIQVWKAYISF